MIGSQGEAALYLGETTEEPVQPDVRRTMSSPYDSLSEYEQGNATDNEDEDEFTPVNPTNVPTLGYRSAKDGTP